MAGIQSRPAREAAVNCACGCGQPVPYSRGAKYASARCRAKASRERNSPLLTAKQCRTLRSAAYWLADYSDILRAGAKDERPEVRESVARLRARLDELVTELRRIARGQGQLPLKLSVKPSVRQRGARLEAAAP